MQLKMKEFRNCLDALPPSSSVSVTCPDHLTEELFTHKGSGTLVVKARRPLPPPLSTSPHYSFLFLEPQPQSAHQFPTEMVPPLLLPHLPTMLPPTPTVTN